MGWKRIPGGWASGIRERSGGLGFREPLSDSGKNLEDADLPGKALDWVGF